MVQLLRLESTTMGQTSQGVKPVAQAKRPVALFSEMKTLGKYLLPLGTRETSPPIVRVFSVENRNAWRFYSGHFPLHSSTRITRDNQGGICLRRVFRPKA